MDRRGFLKQIGVFSAGVVVAPVLISKAMAARAEIIAGTDPAIKCGKGIMAFANESGNIHWINFDEYQAMQDFYAMQEKLAYYYSAVPLEKEHKVLMGQKGYDNFKSII